MAGLVLRTGEPAKDRFRRLCLGSVILCTLATGTWQCWWGGDMPGPRFFIELFPFLAVGLAGLLRRMRRRRLALGAAIVVLTGYAFLTQVTYLVWRATPVRDRLYFERAWDGPRSSSFTPFSLLGTAFTRPASLADRGTAGSFSGRFFKGTQPSAVYIAYQALSGRLPVCISEMTAKADVPGNRIRLAGTLDQPVRPDTQLVIDVFEYERRRDRRARRWGRFVSEVLPCEPPLTEFVVDFDVDASTVRLQAGGRPAALPGHRVNSHHRQIILEARHLYVQVSLRKPPSSVVRRRWVVIRNPWRQAPATRASRPTPRTP